MQRLEPFPDCARHTKTSHAVANQLRIRSFRNYSKNTAAYGRCCFSPYPLSFLDYCAQLFTMTSKAMIVINLLRADYTPTAYSVNNFLSPISRRCDLSPTAQRYFWLLSGKRLMKPGSGGRKIFEREVKSLAKGQEGFLKTVESADAAFVQAEDAGTTRRDLLFDVEVRAWHWQQPVKQQLSHLRASLAPPRQRQPRRER